MKKTKIFILSVISLFLFSCENNESLEGEALTEVQSVAPIDIDFELPTWSFSDSNDGQNMSKSGADKSGNREVVLYMAEYITSSDSDEVGNVIYFNNRGNKQLGADFVADSQYLVIADEDNPCNIYTDKTNDISYYIDESRPSKDLGIGTSTAAIDRAMNTWDDITCSELGIFKRTYDADLRTGARARMAHPICDWVADVVHAGWMPLGFFDWFSRGDGANILAATFTYIVVIDGVPSDDDKNGKADIWFREIYYNDAFQWTDGGTSYPEYDVETASLHESGHGLSQGHFGKAFRSGNFDKENTKVHFSPRAVMNASYSGIQTMIKKTDEGGHCSNWASWPER